jgi:hypothetical protein
VSERWPYSPCASRATARAHSAAHCTSIDGDSCAPSDARCVRNKRPCTCMLRIGRGSFCFVIIVLGSLVQCCTPGHGMGWPQMNEGWLHLAPLFSSPWAKLSRSTQDIHEWSA